MILLLQDFSEPLRDQRLHYKALRMGYGMICTLHIFFSCIFLLLLRLPLPFFCLPSGRISLQKTVIVSSLELVLRKYSLSERTIAHFGNAEPGQGVPLPPRAVWPRSSAWPQLLANHPFTAREKASPESKSHKPHFCL